MGQVKNEMMRQQDLVVHGTEIAVQAGVLQRCEYHSDIVWDRMGDHSDAYRLGNSLYTRGRLTDTFRSRREMTDAIQSAIQDAGADGCPRCDKLLED